MKEKSVWKKYLTKYRSCTGGIIIRSNYPADNNKLGWNEMLAWLRAKRWASLSFGGIVYLGLLVPLLNLLVMPAAVAGATLFWVRERGTD